MLSSSLHIQFYSCTPRGQLVLTTIQLSIKSYKTILRSRYRILYVIVGLDKNKLVKFNGAFCVSITLINLRSILHQCKHFIDSTHCSFSLIEFYLGEGRPQRVEQYVFLPLTNQTARKSPICIMKC